MARKVHIVAIPGDRIQGTWRITSRSGDFEEWSRPDTYDDPTMYKSLIRVLKDIGRSKDDPDVIVHPGHYDVPEKLPIAEALVWAKKSDAEWRKMEKGHQIGEKTAQQLALGDEYDN